MLSDDSIAMKPRQADIMQWCLLSSLAVLQHTRHLHGVPAGKRQQSMDLNGLLGLILDAQLLCLVIQDLFGDAAGLLTGAC